MYAMNKGWLDTLSNTISIFDSQKWESSSTSLQVSFIRYPGTFGDYELLAEYLNMMVLFCIGFLFSSKLKKEKYFAFFAIFLLTIAGFLTGTRLFVIGLIIGGFLLSIVFLFRSGFIHNLFVTVLLIMVFLLFFNFLQTQDIFNGLIYRLLKTDLSWQSYDTRDVVWNVSLSMMQNLPFWGYGTNMMNIFNSIANASYKSPHSLYFFILLISGYPGILSIISIVVLPIFWMLRIYFTKNPKFRDLSIVFIFVWCFWAINEVKIDFFRYPFYMNYVFFMLGLYGSFYYLSNEKNPRD
jgi:O-antigen ligase